MEKSTQMGANRTGIDMSPIHSKEMIRGAQEYTAATPADGELRNAIERQYISASGGVGSVPIPGTMKGALKSMMDKAAGRNPEVLLNKLGERLAYERSGVRLYESAIRKCEAAMITDGSSPVSLEELRQIRDEEAEHFAIVQAAIETLGADPTAQTPDADVSGVAAMGIQRVLNDPRTSVSQCLEMLLSLELIDNAAWELLIELCGELGLDDLAAQFERPLQQEGVHLERVRGWYEQAVLAQASRTSAARH